MPLGQADEEVFVQNYKVIILLLSNNVTSCPRNP